MKKSFSYKPILIKAMMEYADVNGRASMSDIIDYYLNYFKPGRIKVKSLRKRRVLLYNTLVIEKRQGVRSSSILISGSK